MRNLAGINTGVEENCFWKRLNYLLSQLSIASRRNEGTDILSVLPTELRDPTGASDANSCCRVKGLET